MKTNRVRPAAADNKESTSTKTNLRMKALLCCVFFAALACFAVLPQAPAACAEGCDLFDDNTFLGDFALNSNVHGTGFSNTAIGAIALSSNTTGVNNTAAGAYALHNNISGAANTAIGTGSLEGSVDAQGNPTATGSYNTAAGFQSLLLNRDGGYNVADGWQALASNGSGNFNTAIGASALSQNTTGFNNTATGINALFYSNAQNNTADGANALQRNTAGKENSAIGSEALFGSLDANGKPNSTGNFNTATGFQSLYSNQNGNGNVATGWQTLYSNKTGSSNTALGNTALSQNSSGNQNTATGVNALYYNNGSNNTAGGYAALQNNTTGTGNVALGYQAGLNLKTGANNIIIGTSVLGTATDANVTRIGNTTQKKTFIGGIYNKTVASGVSVIVNSSGQLGTVQSSARYKDDIKPMDKASEAILALKPVAFRYKEELDPDHIPQFGLIAEEVEKIDPDLVVRDEEGKVMTVRYDAVNAMLLNEFLKEHGQVRRLKMMLEQQKNVEAKLSEQNKTLQSILAQQQKQIDALTTTVQKASARIDLSDEAMRVVTNAR